MVSVLTENTKYNLNSGSSFSSKGGMHAYWVALLAVPGTLLRLLSVLIYCVGLLQVL